MKEIKIFQSYSVVICKINTNEIQLLGALQVIGQEAMSDDKPMKGLRWGIIGRNVCDRYFQKQTSQLDECKVLLGGMLGAIATVFCLFSARTIRTSDRCRQ